MKAKFHMEPQWDGGMKDCSRGLGHMTRMAATPSSIIFKDLLKNRLAYESQISYGASMGWGNERLFAGSGSHDQDGCHSHIW